VAKLDGDGEAIVVEASEAAMAAVEDVTAEAVEEVRAAAEQQMAALEPEMRSPRSTRWARMSRPSPAAAHQRPPAEGVGAQG
jgi:hypothetical protein